MERERKKILVAVDGSEQTRDIVDYLGGLVPPLKTELVLFHVMGRVPDSFRDWEKEPPAPEHADHLKKWETEREKQIRNLMRGLRLILAEIGMPEYSIMISIQRVKEGIARDLLVEAQRGYDAMIVGRRGFGERKDPLIGSSASKLAARLHSVNLWLVGKALGHEKIMIAMDSSECAVRAVEHVAGMVDPANHTVRLVHVVRGISVSAAGMEDIFPEEYRQRLIEEAENQIRPAFEKAFSILSAAGFSREKISTRVISGVASRAGAIFGEARAGGFGTVVVGRKGLSNVPEFDMGRVTAKLMQLAGDTALWIIA